MFLKVAEEDGLWAKIKNLKNHVGTTVEHPVSPATRRDPFAALGRRGEEGR